MQKHLLTLVLILGIHLNSTAQLYFDFYSQKDTICQIDSSVISVPVNIEVYQTIDDQYDSEIDSTKCFKMLSSNTIDVSQVDINKPLFFRHTVYKNFEETTMLHNSLYNLFVNLSGGMENYQFVDSCTTVGCSEVILVQTIPDESGGGFVFNENRYNFIENCDVSVCIPTQKMDNGQHIADAVLKVHLTEFAKQQGEIYTPSFDLHEEFFYSSYISEDVIIPSFYDQGNDTFVVDPYIFGGPVSFFLHNSPGYPSIDNIHYTNITLQENKPIQQTIIIETYNEVGYFFQDYVQLRGGLVEGNDSLRHHLEIDISSQLCLNFIELVIEGNTDIRFKKGGSVEISDRKACLQFRDGARMIVESNEFRFGRKGIGNLAIIENSWIDILPGSNMVFDGQMLLWDRNNVLENDGAHIDLQAGSSLVFTKDARIKDASGLYVYIHMNGGYLNLSELDPESREKVRLIYPEEIPNEEIVVYPNPTNGYLFLDITEKQEQSYVIYNYSGKVVQKGLVSRDENRIYIDSEKPGLYYLQLENGHINKILKL